MKNKSDLNIISMIKEYNLEPVNNILVQIQKHQKSLLYLQLLAFSLTLVFLILQALLQQTVFNIYFSALWLVVEGVVFLLWIRMKSHSYLDIKVTSFEGKEMHYRNLENYLILRFCKFIGTLFNFLGIVYAIKSMRCLKLLDCTIIICLISFGLAVHWLRIINEVVAFLKKALAMYDNFQMDMSEDEAKAQEMQ